MKLHEALNRFTYAAREGWCGQFIECDSYDLTIHRLPGSDRDLSCRDALSSDWVEFHVPTVKTEAVI